MRRVACSASCASSPALAAGVPDGDNRPWPDGSRHGPWNGGVSTATARFRPDGDALLLSPKAPAAGGEHARRARGHRPLVRGTWRSACGSKTERQLRRPNPRAWEVGWVLWHYTGAGRFYALALKPTGWELSKQDPRYPGGQRFLASGRTPAFPVGSWHRIGIVQVGDQIDVAADGRPPGPLHRPVGALPDRGARPLHRGRAGPLHRCPDHASTDHGRVTATGEAVEMAERTIHDRLRHQTGGGEGRPRWSGRCGASAEFRRWCP
jgi:hypothetical protein